MRTQILTIALIILGFAVVHMVMGYVFTLLSGLSPLDHSLSSLQRIFTFPVQELPEIFHRTTASSVVSWFLSSLVMASLFVLSIYGMGRAFGIAAGATTFGVWCAVIVGAWAWLANPAPDWTATGHRYLQSRFLMLPVPLMESSEEKASRYAIHENLNPGQPFRFTTNQWFWNYRPGASGHPSYDAVMLGVEVEEASSLEEFLRLFTAQRDPSLGAVAWQPVDRTERWEMQTGIPNRAPLPSGERDRVTRIYATAPVNGVWLGLLARDARMPRDRMVSILEAAMASVQPMGR
jgi:hypothetical protein